MKVDPLRSIGAKLFYYMSSLVLITVAGNSCQYMRMFMEFQQEQAQDQAQLSAERAASQLDGTIDGWRAQVAAALPALRATTPAVDHAQRFLDTSVEFLSVELFDAPSAKSAKLTSLASAFTQATADPRFEDKVPTKVRSDLLTASRAWLKRQAPKSGKQTLHIENLTKSVGLPVMALAIRYPSVPATATAPAAANAAPTSVTWVLLTVWQTNLIKALPKSGFFDSAVIDAKGRVFTSPNVADMIGRKALGATTLAKAALAATSASGFEREYKDPQGRRRFGAFARLPKYGVAVLVEQDAETAYQALRQNLYTTALVALLFILFAVAFAYLCATRLVAGLSAVSHGAAKIAAGELKQEIRVRSTDEIGKLAHDVNQMSRRVLQIVETQVNKARADKELETAKIVQSTFFPRTEASNGPIFLSGFYQPAAACGGDLWGHHTLDQGVELVYIGDAMGQGVSAALVTAMAYATTTTVADLLRERPEWRDSPARLLDQLNRQIHDAVRGTISMTFFAAVVDTQRGVITFANAGHNFPVLLPMDSQDPRTAGQRPTLPGAKIQPITLRLSGTPLGMEPSATYTDRTLELRPGDKVLFFTDGLIECSSPKGEVWGRKYLLEQAVATAHLSPSDMKNELLSRAFTFFGSKGLDDDVTAVVMEIDASWQQPVAHSEPARLADLKPKPARHPLPEPPPLRIRALAPLPAPLETGVEQAAAQLESEAYDALTPMADLTQPPAPAVSPAEPPLGIFEIPSIELSLSEDSQPPAPMTPTLLTIDAADLEAVEAEAALAPLPRAVAGPRDMDPQSLAPRSLAPRSGRYKVKLPTKKRT